MELQRRRHLDEALTTAEPAAAPASQRLLLALLLLATAVLVVEPGRIPFFEPDESRYAEIPREMLARGDFVTPRLNGLLYFEKPPLHYWAVALSMAVFGENETAARLPVKVASAEMVLLATLFARRRWGDETGLLAGLIAATSLLVVALARINIIDPGLSLALSAAAFAFASFQEAESTNDARRARFSLYGLHAACAAAVLLKGLIGIVLPGGAIVFFVLWTGRWRLLPRLFSPGPLALFLALAVPWHVLVARRNPGFLQFYFVHEHFQRFAASGHRREGALLYFVPVLVAGLLPWTAFLPRLAFAWPGRSRAAARERGVEAFLFVWAAIVFLFFSVSKSKLIPYVAPIWPALAVLLAVGIQRARAAGATFRFERRLTALLFYVLLVAAAIYGWGAGYASRFGIEGAAVGIVAGLALGAAAILFVSARQAKPLPLAGLVLPIALPWIVFFGSAVTALPRVAREITPWPLAQALNAEMRSGDAVVQLGHYLQAVPFYSKRTTPLVQIGWSELDFGLAAEPQTSMALSRPDFANLWNGTGRVFCVTYRTELKIFANPENGLRQPRFVSRTPNEKIFLLANFEMGRDPK